MFSKSLQDEITAKTLCSESTTASSQGNLQWVKIEMNLAQEAGGVHLYPLGCSRWVFSDVKEEIHGLLQISPVFQWKQEYCLWKHFLTWKNSHDLRDPSFSRPIPVLFWWNCFQRCGDTAEKLHSDTWIGLLALTPDSSVPYTKATTSLSLSFLTYKDK